MATLRSTRPAVQPPLVLPLDVRLMNGVAATVAVLAVAGALVAGVWWLMRSPLFPIRHIQLDGDLLRNSVPSVRAGAAPLLAGNFFSVDLQKGRSAFESVPWVRHAIVRRVWPDTLAVRLEEHRAAALWEGSGSDDDSGASAERLVNMQGEVFDANVGDVEDDKLPRLAGPEGSAAQVLALLRRLQPVFEQQGWALERLRLSGRGSWRADLDTGAEVELGRGSDDEVLARCQRFVRTFADASARWKAHPLEYADLRHTDGYAMRLRGVSLPAPAAPGTAPKNNRVH